MSELTNFLNECVSLFYLEYITKFYHLSRIRLFHQIWKILLNRQKLRSKVPLYDVMGTKCVSKLVTTYFMYKQNYVEIILKKRVCNHRQGATQKLFIYLEANELIPKYLKFGCKGFDFYANEVQNSERGSCCHARKYCASVSFLDNFIIFLII